MSICDKAEQVIKSQHNLSGNMDQTMEAMRAMGLLPPKDFGAIDNPTIGIFPTPDRSYIAFETYGKAREAGCVAVIRGASIYDEGDDTYAENIIICPWSGHSYSTSGIVEPIISDLGEAKVDLVYRIEGLTWEQVVHAFDGVNGLVWTTTDEDICQSHYMPESICKDDMSAWKNEDDLYILEYDAPEREARSTLQWRLLQEALVK